MEIRSHLNFYFSQRVAKSFSMHNNRIFVVLELRATMALEIFQFGTTCESKRARARRISQASLSAGGNSLESRRTWHPEFPKPRSANRRGEHFATPSLRVILRVSLTSLPSSPWHERYYVHRSIRCAVEESLRCAERRRDSRVSPNRSVSSRTVTNAFLHVYLIKIHRRVSGRFLPRGSPMSRLDVPSTVSHPRRFGGDGVL